MFVFCLLILLFLSQRVLTLYFSNKVFYGLELRAKSAEGGARDYTERNKEVDNPDQRIQEDVSSFTSYSLSFFLTIVRTTLDLLSFSAILFSIMPDLFIAIIVFATVGTGATVLVGKVLIRLHYESLQREADFRFSLVRIRENAESIAFYGGEHVEERFTKQKFQRVSNFLSGLPPPSHDTCFSLRSNFIFANTYSYSTTDDRKLNSSQHCQS